MLSLLAGSPLPLSNWEDLIEWQKHYEYLSLSMNTSTENVVEVNDVTQLQIIHYFPVTVFMLRSIAAVLW